MSRWRKNMTKDYGWPTTRCYPRTLAEAFPNDPANYEWFYPPEKNDSHANTAVLGVALWLWVGLAYWWVNA